MLHPEKTGADAVGKPALLAHLGVKPRAHRAGAIDVIDDVGRNEIRIVARKTGSAEANDGLRNVEGHNDALAKPLHGGSRDGLELRLLRQAAKDAVDYLASRRGIEIADNADGQVVARE